MTARVPVLFFGSRDFRAVPVVRESVERVVATFGRELVVIVHGGCGWAPGRLAAASADALAAHAAVELGVEQVAVYAEWLKYGRRAGPLRNQKMLDEWEPVLGLGFCSQKAVTPGTGDMLERLTDAGTPRAVWFPDRGWDRSMALQIEMAKTLALNRGAR